VIVPALPPLSVYVHLPWCLAKCPYCDFNSHVAPGPLPQERYTDGLLADLDFDLPSVAGRDVQTIFFGGGTPSLFAPESIARFLSGLRTRLTLAADVEVTLEANPGATEHGRFAGYRDAGVTRISLGVQSFDDAQLKRLGRIHDSAHVFKAVDEMRAAGFDNFNLDLMYGLPQQTVHDAMEDLRQAIALQPTHVSHYQLTMEPGTVFFHRPPLLPDDDSTWEMQQQCQALLAQHGYEQYEVSAYARAGRRCRHNLNYWQFGDYLGLGAGAHGKITLGRTDPAPSFQMMRTVRQKQPREYLASDVASRLTEHREVRAAELPFEFALNALRLNDGFDESLFEGRTGVSYSDLMPALREGERKGLLVMSSRSGAQSWAATDLGRRFLNDLQALFLPADG